MLSRRKLTLVLLGTTTLIVISAVPYGAALHGFSVGLVPLIADAKDGNNGKGGGGNGSGSRPNESTTQIAATARETSV